MADATNEVRDLWLYDDGSWREGFRDDGKVSPLLHFIARPVAADDAREERLKAATRRAENAEARCVGMARKIIDRIGAVGPENAEDALDRLFRCDNTNAITLKRTDEARCAALSRAEQAEARVNTARVAADLMRARAERAEAALADAVRTERQRIANHLRDLGLAVPAKDVERCPSCYDLGVVGAGDEPCTAVACEAHAAKVREDAARRAKA